MTELNERAYVQVPYGHAVRDLQTYLQSIGWRAGEPATLSLRLAAHDLGVPSDMTLARDVTAKFEAVYDPTHLTRPLRVTWSPSGGGPYPTFSGKLTITEDEDYGTCVLTLSGEYEPPLGVVGKGFDAVIGKRIAIATARRLLEQIRDGMETAQAAQP
ncbi:MAG: hypothetical protein JO277_02215 [Candidatus Eremiobacteraeota bacterium]|nr:hypothetical protein [Candidatus Eremiobacteraeota bacterium]MBV8367161.1 hypothetical protein [Candidatus Eremiobacteraeota bacterium]MBV8720934.1 hypothetical protein [Candidatus Eremiobacteraeota bacterium]